MSCALTWPSPFLLLSPLGGRGRVRGGSPPANRRFATPLTQPSPEGEGYSHPLRAPDFLLLSPLGRGRVRGERRLAGGGQ